jgi:ligand-binding sensor domain-containing protein/serine phosphatase RsbU (regulator of sigma subunit)
MKYTTLFLTSLLLCAINGFSQSYKFRTYTEQDGLESRYINTLTQHNNGNLLIGTGEGLFSFDGFNFKGYHETDGLAHELIESSFQTGDGSIYFGHGNGDVTLFQNNVCNPIRLNTYFSGKVIDICSDKDNNIWFASQNSGLVMYNPNSLIHYSSGLSEYTIFCFYIDENNTIWLGTDLGLVRASVVGNGTIRAEMVENALITTVTDIQKSSNGIYFSTEDSGIYEYQYSKTVQNNLIPILAGNQDLSSYKINSFRVDNNNSIWISANYHGLIELSNLIQNNFTKIEFYNEIGIEAAQNTKISLSDREGNLWIGTIGEGLLKLKENFLATYSLGEGDLNNVSSLYNLKNKLYMGSMGKITVSENQPSNHVLELTSSHGVPEDIITTIYADTLGKIWFGTESNGLYVYSPENKKAKNISLSAEFGQFRINDIEQQNKYVYVATDYGVFQLENNKVSQHYSIETGLPGNVTKALYKDSSGRIWIGTMSQNIPYLLDGKILTFETPIQNAQLSVKCFIEDNNHNIWAGTDGNGVFCITSKDRIIYAKETGLSSDYCYSLLCDDNNRLWASHRGALSRIEINTGAIRIYQTGSTNVGSFQSNGSVMCFSNDLFFATTSGLLRYKGTKDVVNFLEPVLTIKGIKVSDKDFPISSVIELPYGDYKFEITFQGISLKSPEGVTYSYILENYDSEWSKPSSTPTAQFNHLSPGTYIFKVKTFNADGIGGTNIQSITITIEKPFWMTLWFFGIIGILSVVIVRLIIFRRERLLRRNQERLKRALDMRTREVVQQKELLEEKNKDITDSILYAKNIQNAMLPPKGYLTNFFHDAFVYYKPRDIVSGDFYWANQFNSKIVVACADCTGHGVPGAFMSLIGSTLLKDAARMSEVQSPRDLIVTLDKEINFLLNKKMKNTNVHDGMDICIVDFDTTTNILRIASANRPIFIWKDQQMIEVRGDRRSIGNTDEARTEFTLHELTLSKGDSFYMFSDGITDQFGGPDGKKLKRKGLLEFIESNAHLTMSEQRVAFKEYINDWKGELEQLDDMILLACQI